MLEIGALKPKVKRLRDDQDAVCCRDGKIDAPMEALKAQSFYMSMIIDDQVAYRNMGLKMV